MKKTLLIFLFLPIFLQVFLTTLCAISYVESSNGLSYPSLDGGRTEVEMADIDGDGNIDLLSIGDHGSPYVNTNEHGIMVWFGDGTGSWSVFQNGDFGYGGIAVGDIDNDGFLDVGYGMHHNWSGNDFGDQLIEAALGDGTGQNWQPWDDSLATEGQDWGMFGTDFADFNNDGLLDIGSNSFGSGDGVHTYINNGDGPWEHSFGFLGGNSTDDIMFGDVNNDGNADFAVAHQNGTVYIGDGTGNFTLGDGNLPPGGNLGLRGVDLGDANNNGTDEISFCNSNGGVEIWTWVSQNTWSNFSGILPSSGSYEATQIFDMNVDGNGDIVAFGSGVLTIWTGDGAGNWTLETSFTTPSPGYFEALRVGGDADHNGFPDIVIVAREGSWPSDINHIRFFKETSTPDTLYIKPIHPHGYEKFYAGSVNFIDWTSSVPDTLPANVRLELSTTGNNGPWVVITENLPDNGRYQWLISDTLASTNCFVRYTIFWQSDSTQCLTPVQFEIMGSTGISNHIKTEHIYRTNMKVFPTLVTNRNVHIYYTLGRKGPVKISLYDITGKKLAALVNGTMPQGNYRITWNAKEKNNRAVGQGIYFIRGVIQGQKFNSKVIVLK